MRAGLAALLVVLAAAPGDPPALPAGVAPVPIAGVENAYRLGPGLYSGGQPSGPASYEALQKLGIRTVVSVDGAAPDVEAARRYGLRYVHLPIGYDGVGPDAARKLVEVMRSLPGPVYVHCHHGKHRGPAAAAVCARATLGWDAAGARAWMERAGTAADYPGLYDTVERFQVPAPGATAGLDLPERALVPSLVETMVGVDGLWDELKGLAAERLTLTAERARALQPRAVLLAERYREASRTAEVERRGPAFQVEIAQADALAGTLAQRLKRAGSRDGAVRDTEPVQSAARAMGAACLSCHRAYRDHQTPAGP